MDEIPRTYAVQGRYAGAREWENHAAGLNGYDAGSLLRYLREKSPDGSWRLTRTITEVVNLKTFNSTRA